MTFTLSGSSGKNPSQRARIRIGINPSEVALLRSCPSLLAAFPHRDFAFLHTEALLFRRRSTVPKNLRW